MSGSLPLKYRPDSFEFVYGNKHAVDQVSSILKRDISKIPSSWLFIGGSGCGKTTMIRIIKKELGCSDANYHEYNSANTNGIDTIREIGANSRMSAMGGGIKIFMLDECFASGTMVLTPNGEVPIESIKEGDKVYSLFGEDTVTVSRGKNVPLDRVIAMHKSDGSITICSEDHPYYVNNKWIPAKDLTGEFLSAYNCESVHYTNSQIGDKNGKQSMRCLQSGIQAEKEKPNVLFAGMSSSSPKKGYIIQTMYNLWETCSSPKEVLLSKLCRKMEKCTARYSRTDVHKGTKPENKGIFCQISKNGSGKGTAPNVFTSDEGKQSVYYGRSNRKANGIQKDKWVSIFHSSWWKRFWSDSTREVITDFFRELMGVQSHNLSWETNIGISNGLQNRRSTSEIKSWNRSGWWFTQGGRRENTRSKEAELVRKVRVENITFYKSGCNREYFDGIIGDKERNKGTVTFYDLTVKNNPSYVANGAIVHNCHSITGPAQNALLKMLEDSPKNTFFFLATTNPEKLKKAVKTRCTTITMKELNVRELSELVTDIAQEEGVLLSSKIAKAISNKCGGSPREALKILDQVIDIEDVDAAVEAVEKTIGNESDVMELCREFISNCRWPIIAGILKELYKDNDVEGIRRAVLGYFNSVLLGADNVHAAMILEQIIKVSKYDADKAEFTLACYNAVFEINVSNGTGKDVPF